MCVVCHILDTTIYVRIMLKAKKQMDYNIYYYNIFGLVDNYDEMSPT